MKNKGRKKEVVFPLLIVLTLSLGILLAATPTEAAETLCGSGYKVNETGSGIGNWTVDLYLANTTTGVLMWEKINTTKTNDTGFWQFCDLMAVEDYMVCEEQRPGWTNVSPLCYDTANVTFVLEWLNDKPITQLNNFTNHRENESCISGFKLNDRTGDPIAGWTIFIDDDADGQLDAGERNTTTDPDGSWLICNLTDGNYTVCEVLQDGWTAIEPASGCH
ncbi:carboxypeptidase regulatory-like domain-containing protein, partial [candidate division WOR-3 bacterium]|nr:carboxypeptidase regulatory-like domain-containing protein [candidate division WOR-3 bacterium]